MCFHTKLSKKVVELENRFKAKMKDTELYHPSDDFNAFTHPYTPVVVDKNTELIQHFRWGLIPVWAKDEAIKEYTLNARIETIKEKPSFKGSVNKRCLVLVDGFYEWQWLDEKGKKKQKYLIELPDKGLFAMAGIWSEWVNKETGELINTYSIVTTAANTLMKKIHNHKKRMPIILTPDNENEWLGGTEINTFIKCDLELTASPL